MFLPTQAFHSPPLIFTVAFLVRAVLLLYGTYQDAHSTLKYTDIDYYVFTDAARAVSRSASPYTRATYRYTPLLAWLLVPTSWSGKDGLWFHSGKALFALSDLVAGWLIYNLLQRQGMKNDRALKYASVWLLNPMVANISTRGSSEGLLCALVMATLYAFERRQVLLTGSLLGLAVHFKIYPFVYGVSLFWALTSTPSSPFLDFKSPSKLFNKQRVQLLVSSLSTFMALNVLMYTIYGAEFIEHTFLYHFTRTDHRHNFSVYNTLLYYSSSLTPIGSNTTVNTPPPSTLPISTERLAFAPQLLLSTLLLPLLPSTTTPNNLPTTLLAQTLAFVTFNKVCTSQYFLWYLIFLPLYLPRSSFRRDWKVGVTALVAWVGAQAVWLGVGYRLEFLGQSVFVPGLVGAAVGFFGINCWILGVVVGDAGVGGASVDGDSVEGKVVGGEKGEVASGSGREAGAGTRSRKA